MTSVVTIENWVSQAADRAPLLDRAAAFPADDIVALRSMGALAAPLPKRFGGQGAGTEPAGAGGIQTLLRAAGRGNLAVARLFEAHVNALRLAMRFGTAEAQDSVAADARAGHLFGLWVTDAGPPLTASAAGVLSGRKGPCSGAGHCTRALVTAQADGGTRMAVVALSGAEPVMPQDGLSGMRAAVNGTVDLSGVPVRHWIGVPGDYLREPDFSCGAWRASAAAAGALEALTDVVGRALLARGQAEAPMQLARFGDLLVARDTAEMWVGRMAEAAERDGDPGARVAVVNLGRGAVERACLDGIRLAQRSLGMGAFVAPDPAERIARDLAVYLRQPAIDAVLLEAAAWHLARP